jgi:hypothetical protein
MSDIQLMDTKGCNYAIISPNVLLSTSRQAVNEDNLGFPTYNICGSPSCLLCRLHTYTTLLAGDATWR